MSPNDADGMANSVDPDQTAPLGAVWSGSALFAQTYLSENLGSLRYFLNHRFDLCLIFYLKGSQAFNHLDSYQSWLMKYKLIQGHFLSDDILFSEGHRKMLE